MAKTQKVAWATRQAVHTKSVEKVASINELVGKDHFHYCRNRDCRLIYYDACKDVRTNGLCHVHRGVRRPIWVSARDPQECCIGNCLMLAEVKEIVRYQMGGPGPWFQCQKCFRCHGWPCT